MMPYRLKFQCKKHPICLLRWLKDLAMWRLGADHIGPEIYYRSAQAPVQPHGQEDQDDQAPEPDPDKDPTQ